MVDSDAKRHCLEFSEGKGFLGGWTLLAEKLRSLGILTRDEPGKFLLPLRLRTEMEILRGRKKIPTSKR